MKPTKALSGFAEWFWLIAMNIKPVENRKVQLPWFIANYLPCRIYLHASKTIAPDDDLYFILENLTALEKDQFMSVDFNRMRGHIIGEVTITMQFRRIKSINPRQETPQVAWIKERYPNYFNRWFFGPWGYVMADAVLYDEFIPCRGNLGFFEPVLPSSSCGNGF